MILTLGIIAAFFAGMAIVYFAGQTADRPRSPIPRDRLPANNTSTLPSKPSIPPTPAAASQQVPVPHDENGRDNAEFSDTRRFERLTFSGTAMATIYPPQQQVGGEPVRCEVLTRDLCCNGISIVHTHRLLPKQMIVIDAVGKLLVAEVRWCHRIDKDFYVAGCRLIKTTT